MKISALLLTLAVIATSCCSAKQSQTSTSQTPFDKTLVIEDKVTLPETAPESKIPVVQEIPEVPSTPAVPATPEIEMPSTVTVTQPIVTTPKPDVAVEITSQNPSLSHEAWNTLLAQYVTKDGRVDYSGFKNNRSKLTKYLSHLSENLPNEQDSKDKKLAYWMNAYNAMTVDLILRNQPIESIKDIKNPWDQRLWKLGEKWYNLDEIEHQILRKMGDARIHVGINCASFSCPPLLNKAFTEANTQELLEMLAKQFVNDTKRNTISANAVEISNIFKWFSKDFKQNGSVIDFLNRYSTIKISEDAKVRYMEYDWTLNK